MSNIGFLENHLKYNKFTKFDDKQGYAVNVKLQNIGCNEPKYHAILKDNNHEFWKIYEETVKSFELRHPEFTIGFNGENLGYIVLYDKGTNKDYYEDYIERVNASANGNNPLPLNKLLCAVQDLDLICEGLVSKFKLLG